MNTSHEEPKTSADEEAVSDLEILTSEECATVKKTLFELKESWVKRRPEVPFYTLGTSSYLDAMQSGYDYYSKSIGDSNALLWQNFSWLYERLLERLSQHYGETFRYDQRRALPGFHIFLTHPFFTKVSAGRHYDLQHEPLDWSEIGTIEPKKQMSLTLSIDLPAAGSGLLVWDINHLHLEGKTRDEIQAVRDANPEPWVHEYKAGFLAMHSGYYEHQIEPMREYREGDTRITIQAHTLPAGDSWVVYW